MVLPKMSSSRQAIKMVLFLLDKFGLMMLLSQIGLERIQLHIGVLK
jgi:hypothetical protein